LPPPHGVAMIDSVMPPHVEPITRHREDASSLHSVTRDAMSGDEDAFESLHDRFDAGLRRFLQRRTPADVELAEELAQRTWVEAWRVLQGGRFDPERARFSTFLYGVAWKIVLRHRRQAGRMSRRHSRDIDTVAGILDHAPPASDVLELAELLGALDRCLHADHGAMSLTEAERRLVMASAQGATERDLAAAESLAPSTINARKRKAYRKLGACLRHKGFITNGEPLASESSRQTSARRR